MLNLLSSVSMAALLLSMSANAAYAPKKPMGLGDSFHLDFAPIAIERVDPIISPGPQPAQHMHRIFGGNAFYHTYDQVQFSQANCSSTQQQADRSSYWVPQLYARHDNGSVQVVPGTLKAYYGQNAQANETFQVFPPGFRMIAGSPMTHNASGIIMKKSQFEWQCIDNKSKQQKGVPFKRLKSSTFADFNIGCTSGLMHSIYFPNCWNGKDLWLPGSAHMSYSNKVRGGAKYCPLTHPIRLPRIHIEFFWRPHKVPILANSVEGKLELSFGDETGFGWHVDFLNNWQPGALEDIYNTCGGRGIIDSKSCEALDRTNDPQAAKKCRMMRPILQESTGPATDLQILPRLPGCMEPWPADQPNMPACSDPQPDPEWTSDDTASLGADDDDDDGDANDDSSDSSSTSTGSGSSTTANASSTIATSTTPSTSTIGLVIQSAAVDNQVSRSSRNLAPGRNRSPNSKRDTTHPSSHNPLSDSSTLSGRARHSLQKKRLLSHDRRFIG